MFRDCILAVQKCHAFHIYDHKTHVPRAPLHPVIIVGLFAKWGIDFMTCNPHSTGGYGYITVVVDYFTKWVEAMPTYNNTDEKTSLFFFNHVIVRFGVPQAIVTNHGKHLCNHMMSELTAMFRLSHDISTPY